MLSCTSVRVRARCLFSCSDQTHQGWLLSRRHHRVSIMNVQVANVNLKSSNSPLPLGVNRDAATDSLVFLAFVLQFSLHFLNSSTDRNRRMKLRRCPCRITVFIPESWCTTHHLLTEEARNENGPVQNLHLPDRCCIRLLQIKSISKMLIKTSSNLLFVYTDMHNCTVTECISPLPCSGSCQFLVWCLVSFTHLEKNMSFSIFSSARQPLNGDLFPWALAYLKQTAEQD